MIVTEKGKYKLLKDLKTRNSVGAGTIPEGTAIKITQIDNIYHKVIGPELMGWMYWDLPVEKEG